MAKIRWEIVKVTKIGNSYGIILNRKMMDHLQLKDSRKLSVVFRDNTIELKKASKVIPVNLDRSTWEKQIDEAIKESGEPEESIWPDYMSEEADKDWTW